MNKERRKRLGKAFDLVTEAEQIIQEVMEEERESMENLPDNFRYGDRGDEMQNYIDMMDEVIGYCQDAESVIEQI
ncbi:MAG: hypothetical protein J6N19_14420 [Clostridium sp.]|nr:hypothetical protein [Clostridium sp.]